MHDADEHIDWVCNDEADRAAKLGAHMHPKCSNGEAALAQHRWQTLLELGHATAKCLALWPMAAQRFGGRLGVPVCRRA